MWLNIIQAKLDSNQCCQRFLLWGGPQGVCRTLVLHHLTCAVQLADLCRLFAVCVSKSLCILPPSHELPSSWFAGFLVSNGQVSFFHWNLSVWQYQLSATSWGGSCYNACYGYLPSAHDFLLPANSSGTSSQTHLLQLLVPLQLKCPLSNKQSSVGPHIFQLVYIKNTYSNKQKGPFPISPRSISNITDTGTDRLIR